jgi:phosphate:Na+ symporter
VAVSPASPGLEGAARLAAEVPRQVANANTLFNVLNTIALVGFTGLFARLATKLIPARAQPETVTTPRFLDRAALSVPAVAFEQVRQELGRIGEILRTMLVAVPQASDAASSQVAAEIAKGAQQIEALENAILDFLGCLRQGTLTQGESETHVALMTATVHFRELAEIIGDDLLTVGQAAANQPSIRLDEALVSELYRRVQQAVELAVRAVHHNDIEAAEAVQAMSGEIRQLADGLMARLAADFDARKPESPVTLRLETTIVDALRGIFTLSKRIARSVSVRESLASDQKQFPQTGDRR